VRLPEAGVETFESCEGEDGHAVAGPTVRSTATGLRAFTTRGGLSAVLYRIAGKQVVIGINDLHANQHAPTIQDRPRSRPTPSARHAPSRGLGTDWRTATDNGTVDPAPPTRQLAHTFDASE
jgi:hypothetical protein